MSQSVKPRRRRRIPVVVWVAVCLIVVISVIAALGGFSMGDARYNGPRYEPGEVIRTQFWDVTVEEASLNAEYAELSVSVTAMNLFETPFISMTDDVVIAFDRANREQWEGRSCTAPSGRPLNPMVNVSVVCTFAAPAGEVELPESGELEFRVIVLNQELGDNLLVGEEIVPTSAAGHLDVVARVR